MPRSDSVGPEASIRTRNRSGCTRAAPELHAAAGIARRSSSSSSYGKRSCGAAAAVAAATAAVVGRAVAVIEGRCRELFEADLVVQDAAAKGRHLRRQQRQQRPQNPATNDVERVVAVVCSLGERKGAKGKGA